MSNVFYLRAITKCASCRQKRWTLIKDQGVFGIIITCTMCGRTSTEEGKISLKNKSDRQCIAYHAHKTYKENPYTRRSKQYKDWVREHVC